MTARQEKSGLIDNLIDLTSYENEEDLGGSSINFSSSNISSRVFEEEGMTMLPTEKRNSPSSALEYSGESTASDVDTVNAVRQKEDVNGRMEALRGVSDLSLVSNDNMLEIDAEVAIKDFPSSLSLVMEKPQLLEHYSDDDAVEQEPVPATPSMENEYRNNTSDKDSEDIDTCRRYSPNQQQPEPEPIPATPSLETEYHNNNNNNNSTSNNKDWEDTVTRLRYSPKHDEMSSNLRRTTSREPVFPREEQTESPELISATPSLESQVKKKKKELGIRNNASQAMYRRALLARDTERTSDNDMSDNNFKPIKQDESNGLVASPMAVGSDLPLSPNRLSERLQELESISNKGTKSYLSGEDGRDQVVVLDEGKSEIDAEINGSSDGHVVNELDHAFNPDQREEEEAQPGMEVYKRQDVESPEDDGMNGNKTPVDIVRLDNYVEDPPDDYIDRSTVTVDKDDKASTKDDAPVVTTEEAQVEGKKKVKKKKHRKKAKSSPRAKAKSLKAKVAKNKKSKGAIVDSESAFLDMRKKKKHVRLDMADFKDVVLTHGEDIKKTDDEVASSYMHQLGDSDAPITTRYNRDLALSEYESSSSNPPPSNPQKRVEFAPGIESPKRKPARIESVRGNYWEGDISSDENRGYSTDERAGTTSEEYGGESDSKVSIVDSSTESELEVEYDAHTLYDSDSLHFFERILDRSCAWMEGDGCAPCNNWKEPSLLRMQGIKWNTSRIRSRNEAKIIHGYRTKKQEMTLAAGKTTALSHEAADTLFHQAAEQANSSPLVQQLQQDGAHQKSQETETKDTNEEQASKNEVKDIQATKMQHQVSVFARPRQRQVLSSDREIPQQNDKRVGVDPEPLDSSESSDRQRRSPTPRKNPEKVEPQRSASPQNVASPRCESPEHSQPPQSPKPDAEPQRSTSPRNVSLPRDESPERAQPPRSPKPDAEPQRSACPRHVSLPRYGSPEPAQPPRSPQPDAEPQRSACPRHVSLPRYGSPEPAQPLQSPKPDVEFPRTLVDPPVYDGPLSPFQRKLQERLALIRDEGDHQPGMERERPKPDRLGMERERPKPDRLGMERERPKPEVHFTRSIKSEVMIVSNDVTTACSFSSEKLPSRAGGPEDMFVDRRKKQSSPRKAGTTHDPPGSSHEQKIPVDSSNDPYSGLTEGERLAALELAEKLRRRAANLKRRRRIRERMLEEQAGESSSTSCDNSDERLSLQRRIKSF